MRFDDGTNKPILNVHVLGSININDQTLYLLSCRLEDLNLKILYDGNDWFGLEEDSIRSMSSADKDMICSSIKDYLE